MKRRRKIYEQEDFIPDRDGRRAGYDGSLRRRRSAWRAFSASFEVAISVLSLLKAGRSAHLSVAPDDIFVAGQLGQAHRPARAQLLRGNAGMLADERKDFQPVDQLFAVLVRFFALADSNRSA